MNLIEKIHGSEGHWGLAVTGGGTSALADLAGVAGASDTIAEACIPYHSAALSRYLGTSAPQGCNTGTARAMAVVAYRRARQCHPEGVVFGLGCSAAIATNRERRGDDRCHVAIQSAAATRTHDLALDKQHDRAEQEKYCNRLIIGAMAQALGVRDAMDAGLAVRSRVARAGSSWRKLLAGEVQSTATQHYRGLFPGAFNPLHDAHRGMIKVAVDRLGGNIALEVSIRNVDKPPLDFLTMRERAAPAFDLVFSDAPTFVEKSAIFPGATFIVGLDTIIRVDDPQYYGGEPARDAAVRAMAQRGNRFLVFGRHKGGDFQTLSSVSLTPGLALLCDEVPEDEFRVDISSTALRSRAAP